MNMSSKLSDNPVNGVPKIEQKSKKEKFAQGTEVLKRSDGIVLLAQELFQGNNKDLHLTALKYIFLCQSE